MEQIVYSLAGWLHDIGKFAQRANAPCTQGMDQEYCPNGTSHRHVLYTDYFIEHVLPLPPELEHHRSELARLAAAHHRPNTASREERALQRADWLSSGGDRLDGDAEGDYKTARLESIFTQVRLNGKGLPQTASPLRYRLRPIDAMDADDTPPIFPKKDALSGNNYKELYEQFCTALKKVPCDMGVRLYMASLVSLLEQYTWCIPSSTYHTRADISLYDHAATTAAIVQALLACPAGNEQLLITGGELSGIQKFIFGEEGEDRANKGASKLLRARSLYLQGLTRSVWLTLLDRMGLSPVAKIMDAGGRFVLLLPDTPQHKQQLEATQHNAETWLYQQFHGNVRMTFATLSIRPDELKRETFRNKFEDFNDAMEVAKLHPFATVWRDGFSPVAKVDYAAYAEKGECDFCRARPATDKLDETPICGLCRELIQQIGSHLPNARYLVYSRTASDGVELFGGLRLSIIEKGKDAPQTLFEKALDVVNISGYDRFSAVPVAGYIPQITLEDKDRWQSEGRLCEQDGEECMAGDPVTVNAPKSFAMLAAEARVLEKQGWRSIACLGACKADVDNLGLLFGMGFGVGKESLFSISRFAMLSRMMNFFFGSYVPRLMEREFSNMYLIFAGGDDLFALGPWSEVVRFALRLQNDFSQFTGNNPAVTFSAGLPVFKPRLPMRALRRAAEEALDTSKEHPDKNAGTLFGVTAEWPLFQKLCEKGEWLEGLCLKGEVTQGFVRRLLGYARECHDFNKGDIRKGLYLSHMDYDMKRNCSKESPDMDNIRRMGQDKDTFPYAALGITWALYRTRTTG